MSNVYTHELTVRYRDLDTMYHANNAVYATYLEQARAAFFRDVLGLEIDEVTAPVARLEVDFRSPIELGDDVVVELRIADVGTSSMELEYEVVVGDRAVASARSVQVSIDPETGASSPIPEAWRSSLREWMD